jgi:hypothetical protein
MLFFLNPTIPIHIPNFSRQQRKRGDAGSGTGDIWVLAFQKLTMLYTERQIERDF